MAKSSPVLRRLLMALARRLLRFGVFVLFWTICATLYYQFAKPDFRPATHISYFGICADKIGDSSDDFPVHPLEQIQQNPNAYRLCDTPRQWQSDNVHANHLRMELSQRSDGNWYLKQWTDSMSDPFETIYHLDGNTITPLFYRSGTQLTRTIGIFFGLFLGLGLSRLF
ncbi:MAG: hypothetical protein Q4A69_03850 [Moraxella sp.]|nr:hypothetical protein [Moraxella sp.]